MSPPYFDYAIKTSAATTPLTNIIEDFERSSLNNGYGGDTGSASITDTRSINGTRSLQITETNNFSREVIATTDVSLSSGNTYSAWFWTDSNSVSIVFGAQSATNTPDGYHLLITPDDDFINLHSGWFGTDLFNVSQTLSLNTWYEVVFNWGSSGSLTVTINESDGTQVFNETASDTAYSSGGIAWANRRDDVGGTGYFDYLTET